MGVKKKMSLNFSKRILRTFFNANSVNRNMSQETPPNGILANLTTLKQNTDSSTSKSKRPFTIVVEGNIGAGKTTFLKKFASNFPEGIEISEEPVDKWRNCKGHNLLNMMYSDAGRWSLLFQTYVQLTLIEQHLKSSEKPIKVMERSLLSARFCFVENLYANGNMSDAEYQVISEWYNFLVTCPQLDFGVDLIVYLRTQPETAYRRILNRSRKEEKTVPLFYIKDLHSLHEDWLFNKTKFQPLP